MVIMCFRHIMNFHYYHTRLVLFYFRQGLVKSKESFHALIEKYLPMEYRQEIIPTAKSGNKVVPKEKT